MHIFSIFVNIYIEIAVLQHFPAIITYFQHFTAYYILPHKPDIAIRAHCVYTTVYELISSAILFFIQ